MRTTLFTVMMAFIALGGLDRPALHALQAQRVEVESIPSFAEPGISADRSTIAFVSWRHLGADVKQSPTVTFASFS